MPVPSFLPADSVKLLPAVCPGPDAWARQRVARLRPELRPSSPTYLAAVVLLCADDTSLNIDRLARRTGFPRHQIAACARRLYDNGVWVDGRTDYAWTDPGEPGFWNDVAVAEGKLTRRRDENGVLEWGAAGLWRKAYDYVRAAEGERVAVVYLAAPPAHALPEAEAAPPAPAPARPSTPRLPRRPTPSRRDAGSARAVTRAATVRPAARAASGATVLFPSAVWLC